VILEWSALRASISGRSCRHVLRRVIFAIVLMLAAGTSLSTSAPALATPLGPWLPNPPIDLSTTGQNAQGPQVATGPDGTTTITWNRYNGSNNIVQAATRAANATTFSTPIDLSTTGQDADSPQVAIGPDGTTTITWTRYNGREYIVQAATRTANATTFSTPIDISTTGQNAFNPQVATGPDGTTTITWNRFNGSEYIVQAVTATPPPSVLTITKTGNGTVTSTPANINCGTTCTATIANLINITLTATPTAESTFSGWSGDCTGTSTCTVSMTQARNVTATFTPRTPSKIRWNTGKRTTNQPITSSFTAAPDTTYTITATSNAARRFQTRATRTARGTCKITTNKKTHKRTATCTIRLKQAGTWLVKITPTQNGSAGTPATKTIKIRTPRPPATTHPTVPVTG